MENEAFQQFLTWEVTTRDTIDFKKIYVDIAGDLIAGLLLSQIIYWHLPSKNGQSKLKSIRRDGHYWIAKSYADWWDEIRISQYQAKRALTILANTGIVEVKIFKFNGAPTAHVRLVFEAFMEQWNEEVSQNIAIGNATKSRMETRESRDSLIETNNIEVKNMQANACAPKPKDNGHLLKEKKILKKPFALPDPQLRWLKDGYRELGLAFLEYAGQDYNVANRSEISLWYRELNTWRMIGVNADMIKAVIDDMRKSGLSIKSPVSLTGMLRNYKSVTARTEANVFTGVEEELY